MSLPFTLQFATYSFPNSTFEVDEHRIDIDTPAEDIRRKDGAVIQDGFLRQKRWRINGKLFGTDIGSVRNALNVMKQSVHNRGLGASFFYRADHYAFAHMSPGGFVATPEKGLYEYLYDINIFLVSDPYVENIILQIDSGSRSNNSAVDQTNVGGNYPASPIFTFVAGTWNFGGAIRVENLANSYFFQYSGGLLAGQTLVIDCVAGSVMRQVGLTMIDSLSYFGGNLDFIFEPGGVNDLMINAPTLNFSLIFKDRFYI